jgi:tripartite-type tricarboxylate transporter receptor subunit TctC
MSRFTPLLASLLVAGGAAHAATDYPTGPITVIVPHAAGGPTDTVSRLVAESMTQTLGQTVLVENAGGAGSTVGTRRAARAEPDGYTLLINHVAQATSATLYRKLAYDPDGAFDGVGLITDVPMTLVARGDFEPNTVAELLDHIRANKDDVTYAHAGVGSASHLCGMLLMDALALDVPMTTVPYKGTGPAMTDLLGGQVDMMCDQTTNTVPQIEAGKIKGYAVTTPERLPVLPDLPTLDEAGLEGFEMTVWHGLYAPAGTPKEILEKLSAALQVAVQDPKVVERFAQLGTAPVAPDQATPAALDQHLAAEIGRWKPIIQAAGAYAD